MSAETAVRNDFIPESCGLGMMCHSVHHGEVPPLPPLGAGTRRWCGMRGRCNRHGKREGKDGSNEDREEGAAAHGDDPSGVPVNDHSSRRR